MTGDNNKLSLSKLSKLSQNLLEILNEEEYCDVTIEVGDDPSVKVFRAHMAILYSRSPYLRRILSTNKDTTHIKLPGILPEAFQVILKYIYGGELSLYLDVYDVSDIIKILVAANKLCLHELIDYLQSILIENKTNCLEKNFNLIYQTCIENDSLVELRDHCIDLITKDPVRMLKLINYTSISERLLILLIRSDNLQMSESQVWESVIQWGLAKNPELASDPSSFSKNDFITLKNTLQKCIPFIRFYSLTPKEFSEKVLPYKKILPKELRLNLIKHFLSPNDVSTVSKENDKLKPRRVIKKMVSKAPNSNIITHQHIELISKWVDRSETQISPHRFDLLFRASRDGFSNKRFHEICDGVSKTVTIIKVKGSVEVLGGYNPIAWRSDSSTGLTKNSFIFSFGSNIESYILSRVKNHKHAINNYPYFGPSFGYGDLYVLGVRSASNGCVSRKNTYEKPIRKTDDDFFIEECEVFHVV